VVIAESETAAYDPSSDTWRTIPQPSMSFTDADVLWTGSEVIVFGARQGPGGGEPPLADGLLLDPVTDIWRDVADVDLPAWRGFPGNIGIDANLARAVWNGSRMVVVDYGLRTAAFDPASDTWSSLPPLPTNGCEGSLAAAAVASGDVMVQVCGEVVTLAPESERWHVVLGRGEAEQQTTGDGYYLDPLGAGDVFLLFGTSFDQGHISDPVLLAYRPEADSSVPSARDAWDVAAAFASLRTHYPYDPDSIAPEVQANMDQLLAPWVADAYENRDETGLKRLWAYYYGFEVLRVDGLNPPFVAVVRFTGDETFTERLTLAPEVGVDGVEHQLVIIAAEPGGD
jgi:hypothetical protein